MTSRCPAVAVLLAAFALGCAKDSNQRPPGQVGGTCKTDGTCEQGVCDPVSNECVQGGTESSESGTDESSTSAGQCVLETEGEEIPSRPDDRPGDECCTTESACTGREFNDMIPNPLYFGERLECTDGVWVVNEDTCVQNCAEWGEEMGRDLVYVGCYWDDGVVVCGCSDA